MRTKGKVARDALCPYYVKEYEERISCLSMEKSATCHLIFNGKSQKDAFKKEHCCSDCFRECEYYKAHTALIEKRLDDAERRKKHN